MKIIWETRENGADTEEQLVSEILKLLPSTVRTYKAQNDLIVLDSHDLLQLAEELVNETN
jgi:hypothetical protein